MKPSLVEIPSIEARHETIWKIRALVMEDSDSTQIRDPVRSALKEWAKYQKANFKAIMKVMKLCGQQHRIQNPKHVKKTTNPAHGEVYEMLAYTDTSRLMFFYDEDDGFLICTNPYEKSSGSQDAAFQRCASIRNFYLSQKCLPKHNPQ